MEFWSGAGWEFILLFIIMGACCASPEKEDNGQDAKGVRLAAKRPTLKPETINEAGLPKTAKLTKEG